MFIEDNIGTPTAKESAVCTHKDASSFPSKALNTSEDDIKHQGCFSPRRASFRFIGLICTCFMTFGSYFCYDNPGALQDYFESNLHMSAEKFVMLYSSSSWPNAIMGFIGGFLLDSVFGIRWGTIIYMTLAIIGQLTFAMGVYINAFWLMIIGRLIFGIGTDSLTIAQNIYSVLWFKGKELNMVFGLQMSFVNVGFTINFLIMENIHNYVLNTLGYEGPKSIGITLFFAALIFVPSTICILLLSIMDRKAEKVLRRNKDEKMEIMKLQDLKDFRDVFWLVAFVCVTYYINILPFLSLSKLHFITKYQLAPETANTVTSLVFIISAVASPLIGIVVDKTGNNILWIILSIIGTFLSHSLIAFTYISPYVSMAILGLSLSLFSGSFWTLIAVYVRQYQLGTAYGIVTALNCFGLAVVPIFCGIIVDKYGYFVLEIFFLFWLSISLVIAVIVCILERNATALYSVKGVTSIEQ